MTVTPRQVAEALLATFRPRADVFARRYDDPDHVASANAYLEGRGINRRFRVGDFRPVGPWDDAERRRINEPLTVEAVERHVRGARRNTVGFYPLRPDGTTATVSIDLDNHRGGQALDVDPREDLDALVTVCLRRGVRYLANHSRGGRGYWLHLILPDGVRADRARALMLALVRAAGLRHVSDGGSFDAIYPKQSDLSGKGVGTLYCAPVCGRWLRSDPPGSHFLDTDPNDLDAQYRALTEY